MSDLRTQLGEAVAAAFAAEGVDAALARVTPSDRPDLADFQSNGALAAAKEVMRQSTDAAGDYTRTLDGAANSAKPMNDRFSSTGVNAGRANRLHVLRMPAARATSDMNSM